MRFLPAVLVAGASVGGYAFQYGGLSTDKLMSSWITTEGESDDADLAGSTDADDAADLTDAPDLGTAGPPEADQMTRSPVPAPARAPVAAASSADFSDVFRFDLTPREISERWPGVASALGARHEQGCRVPLVTGTAPADIAGSLAYYFDDRSGPARIVFLGTTGDPARLVDFITRQFGFRRSATLDPRQTTFSSRGPWRGQLQVEAPRTESAWRRAFRGEPAAQVAAPSFRIALTIERRKDR